MKKIPTISRALALTLLTCGAAIAADWQVLGKKLRVRNPGAESDRVVVVFGREKNSPVPNVGDPTTNGASLTVIANGASATTQVISLDAPGWTLTPTGYNYAGPTNGDPVRRVIYRRSANGVAVVTAVLRGNVGTTDLMVTPPNPGDDGGVVLQIGGGDRYCVSFGGAAGGAETRDDAAMWSIRNATAAPGCPVSSLPTTTSTSSTTSTTLVACGASAPACDGSCPPSYHCESVGAACFCFTGGSNACATCDTPCTGSDVCASAVETMPPYLAHCTCVTPPVCASGVCGGNCQVGATCADPSPGGTACDCYIF